MADRRSCRHVWVDCSGDVRCPGLVLAWRRDPVDRHWAAQVALVRAGFVLVEWVPAARLHPVVDDRWGAGRER